MRVEYIVDSRDVERELRRLEDFDLSGALALDGVLASIFAATQLSVHVITGALKATGRMSSTFDDNDWQGIIEYGAPPLVDYAEYEQRRRGTKHGTPHDFMTVAREMDSLYEESILLWMSGDV